VPECTFTPGQTLAKVPIFSGLTENELAFLSQRAVPRHYSAGETVFGEGDPCSGLYLVESGQVRIFKSSASGREQVLSIDGPGSSIAELPVFDGGNYPASVAAIGDATLLFVSKQDFQALCLAHPQVALKVLRVLVRVCAGWSGSSKSFHSPQCAIVWLLFSYVLPKKKASVPLKA
jgi:CRP/FNR family transcriptional regulator, cyclic AMP receptor protein